jgi:enterobactin synthetase component D
MRCSARSIRAKATCDISRLPHHAQLANAGRKRKTEHLAGRIAAVSALKSQGITTVPGIGINGEPLWPNGISGSITHSGKVAMAIVSENSLTGIDCEAILDENEAIEIKEGVIDSVENTLLQNSELPFSVALTLTFSAKESLFKALFPRVNAFMGFETARVTSLSDQTLQLTLRQPLAGFQKNHTFTLFWRRFGNQVMTLIS